MKTTQLKASVLAILLGLLSLASSRLFSNEQKEPLLSASEDEETALGELIFTTEERLRVQKQLQDLMVKFKIQKKQFSMGRASKRDAFLMVKTASEILRLVREQHIQHVFSPVYLEELNLFSSIAGKNTPVRP